jgi:hypothetical protein
MPRVKVELSEYERKRQENIARTQELLRNLEQEAAQAGLAPTSKSAAKAKPKSRKPAAKIKKEEVVPLRTSSRLRGIVADSEVAKRKAEDETEAQRAAERVKRQRVSGDLNLGDILVSGKAWDPSGNFLTHVGPARPYERTFKYEEDDSTPDKNLKELRKRMGALGLWDAYDPGDIKITPEKIVSCCFGADFKRKTSNSRTPVLNGIPSDSRQTTGICWGQIRQPGYL